MKLNTPEVQEKITEWQNNLRAMTGNFRVVLVAHIQPAEGRNIDDLIRVVCEETGIPMDRIRMRTRKREVVIARQLLVYYGRAYYGMSYSELGGLIGGRDHSTAIHAKQSIEDLIISKNDLVCLFAKKINKRLEERNNGTNH